MDTEPPQLRISAAYIGLILIWSSTPLAVVLSLRDLDAMWSLGLRMILAALLAQLVLRVSGQRLVWSREALAAYAVGSLSVFGAMFFTYLGARHLPSGLVSILFGSAPLLVGLGSRIFLPGTRLAAPQWLGMLLGLAGLVCMFGRQGPGGHVDLPSVGYVLAGVSCYAASAIVLKQGQFSMSPLVQTAGALLLSALCCVVLLVCFRARAPQAMPGPVSLLAVLYSASFGSIVAMLSYFFLLRHIAPGTVALTTLVNPVFALCLGMLVNHESFRPQTLVGMGMIFLGLLAYYSRELLLYAGRRAATATG